MKDVFQNSYLTVAAADSLDPNSAILFPRSSADSPEVKVEWQDSITRQKVTAQLQVDKTGRDRATSIHYSHSESYLNGPLNQRAWTLQERLLPCRVLHYTSDELAWECQTMRGWEGTNSVKMIDESLALAAYSCRGLSYDDDKISGISEIADPIGQHVRDKLVHGLWMKDIAKGLLWTLSSHPQTRRTTLQAPSWSWAFVHGHIVDFLLNRGSTNHFPQIQNRMRVNYQYRIPSKNDTQIDTQRAEEGVLKITGLCRIATLEPIKNVEEGAIVKFEGDDGHMRPQVCLDTPFSIFDDQSENLIYPCVCLCIGIWTPYSIDNRNEEKWTTGMVMLDFASETTRF
ncbi:hypothetical protein G7Y89_g14165 [Cudoniella acicularis]|uniref:Heterokaryon incompatibility domain-containing protein n=1 Tax=Cudoniella acicularis TaxID=354080 RepID=A0A8H4VVB3_9HELO|nr:hypothetical protein G7Y89_g14165 [Cudoniella acicularis]